MKRHSSAGFQTFSLFLLLISFASSTLAQKDTGSVVGTVKDSSGALIPDAKITVTETEKGTTFVTSSDASGEYVLCRSLSLSIAPHPLPS